MYHHFDSVISRYIYINSYYRDLHVDISLTVVYNYMRFRPGLHYELLVS